MWTRTRTPLTRSLQTRSLQTRSPLTRSPQTRSLQTRSLQTRSPLTRTPLTRSLQTRTWSSQTRWRVLFFGTDEFALESLRELTCSRDCSGGVVDTLEVVTLPGDVPVKRFAQQNRLPLHQWPVQHVGPRFHVGVVVSFGCLLPESLIKQFPLGILNMHPSLLPRWRGPAPIFHTILHGDAVTGVTVMQIRPHRFDVGPILSQELHHVPPNCRAEELGAALAKKGARLLINTLTTLPESIAQKKEQRQTEATFAPKITVSLSWVLWDQQTCEQIDRLYRAIGSQIPLRTTWMGKTIKLLEYVGRCHISLSDGRRLLPGSVSFQKDSNTLAVCCKDGWVGFRSVVLKKRMTAADFYNGYLHQNLQKSGAPPPPTAGHFVSPHKELSEPHRRGVDTLTHQ